MSIVRRTYIQHHKFIENVVYPLILFFYPLVMIFQGLDLSDSTYSLANYMYFSRMEGMWVISTYVSNVVGFLLTLLPGGMTLIGMKIYTGICLSGLVLLCYFGLRRHLSPVSVFLGEMIAVGLCWIPTTILYNYLTYFFFALGLILLYEGIIRENKWYYFGAGVSLGLNVMVRVPNVTEAVLIIGLWYAMWLKKETFKATMQATGVCIAGYVAGLAAPLLAVHIQYGKTALIDMIQGLSGVASSDDTYTPWSMVSSVIHAYSRSFMWVAIVMMGILMGVLLFAVKKDKFLLIKKMIYFSGIALVLRFFWGRGMFSFRYYEDYTSIFEWGMLGLYLSLAVCLCVMAGKYYRMQEKVMAMLVFLVILVTPLGSNNYTCQNLNNLFVVAPFVIYMYRVVFKGRKNILLYPLKSFVTVIAMMILIQSIGFHFNFVFRDGMDGADRDVRLENTLAVNGIYTTEENAEDFMELSDLCNAKDYVGKEAICYGNIPGLHFVLRMPFALTNAWPDLDSYGFARMQEELQRKESPVPVVILSKDETTSEQMEDKKEFLLNYVNENGYENVFENERYCVYQY